MHKPMHKPVFMSAEHVELMNRLLAADAAGRHACRALDRRYVMAYELRHEPHTVWWSMEFDPAAGMRFGLSQPHGAIDILFQGDYRAVLDAMRRTKAGESPAPALPLSMTDSGGALQIIGPAFAAAQQAATIDSEIPAA